MKRNKKSHKHLSDENSQIPDNLLKSRRDFFKLVVKTALPTIAFVGFVGSKKAIASIIREDKSENPESPVKGSRYAWNCSENSCRFSCTGSCHFTCEGMCDTTCEGMCRGHCGGSCSSGAW